MKDSKKILGIALLGGAGLMLFTPKGQEMLASIGGGAGGAAGEESTAIAGKEQEYKIIETQEVPTPAPTFVFQTPDFKGIFYKPEEPKQIYTPLELKLPTPNGGRFGTGSRAYTAKKIVEHKAPVLSKPQQTVYSKLVAGQLSRWGYRGGGYILSPKPKKSAPKKRKRSWVKSSGRAGFGGSRVG